MLGVSIMTYNNSLAFRATYEAFILRQSNIPLKQKFEPLPESNPGPFDHELSALAARPRFVNGHSHSMSKVKMSTVKMSIVKMSN